MQEEVGHYEKCGICSRGWDIAKGVEYAGVGGTLQGCGIFRGPVGGILREVETCKGCGICRRDRTLPEMQICRRRWDIAGGVERVGGGGQCQMY